MNLITEHLDIWTAAQTPKANGGRGRGKNKNGQTSYGIKKLRELILELAVRGKLVPQDPNDEPASVLLEKITKEKARLIKEGKIKKQKRLPEIGEDEVPYKTPESWEWTRLGILGDWGAGATPSRKNPAYYGGKMPWLKSGELRDNEHLSDSEETVTKEALESCSLRICQPGDVLIAMYGATIGMLAIVENIVTTNQAVCACTCNCGVFNRYLFLMLKAWRAQLAGQGAGGAQPNISKVKITNTIAPLPPLAEQNRIVTKVDELMTLCDQLEQQQTDSNATHQILVETLLATLTNAADQKEFSEAWQRIADHFDTLFTTEQRIDHLKQTILQLAVMGKLVPQDPNDEPASVLLEKIAKEKARLIKEGKIKKQKPLPDNTREEKPFELPRGWDWEHLGNIAILKGGFAYKSSVFSDSGEHQVIRMGNIRPDYFRLDERPVFIRADLAEETSEYQIEPNDILVTMTGTKGKRDYLYSLIVQSEHLEKRKLFLNQRLCIVRGLLLVFDFLNMLIKDDRFLDAIYEQSTGTANQANIGMVALNNWILPVPPIQEQHRIVAKVDELMALCDNLKARLNDAQAIQMAFADAILEKAVA